MTAATDRSAWNYAPLAVAIVLHLTAATVYVWTLDRGISYPHRIAGEILIPVQISLLAVWLATQRRLWQRMPWALIALAAMVAWYNWGRYFPNSKSIPLDALLILMLPSAVLQLVVIRSVVRPGSPRVRRHLGLRHLMLWTTAIAVLTVITRMMWDEPSYQFVVAGAIDWQLLLLSTIVTCEYVLMALAVMLLVLRRKFWPWIVPLVLVVLPGMMLVESILFVLLFGYPWYFEWEGILVALPQIVILSVSLLAWRYSGQLMDGRP